MADARPPRPQRAVVVLLDSLNRHLLGAYGGSEFDTPNLDRFARRAVRFERHFAGSLPCMPARHDILCGALDFLWRPWGSIEIWEEPLTAALRREGVTTQLDLRSSAPVRDRRRELPLRLHAPGTINAGTRATPGRRARIPRGSARLRSDAGTRRTTIPAAGSAARRTFRGRARSARPRAGSRDDAPHHERFLLFVDEFDPHEPFDTPEPWASRYDPDWEGPHLIWPPYTRAGLASGVLTPRQARQIRACYGAKLSMIDHWLGRVLDALDQQALWNDTAVIVCTDHGHYLGEKDAWGKPPVPLWEPIGHTPLLIAWPGVAPGACDALTTNVDLHATLLDLFGASAAHRTHGRSLVPLLEGTAHERARPRARRLLGPRGALDRRAQQVRARAGAAELSALGLVEPLVDDAGPPSPAAPAPGSGRPRHARSHARLADPRAAPALPRR